MKKKKKPRTAKEILRKQKQNRRHNSLRLQTKLGSYSNQNNMVTGTKTRLWINGTE